MVVHVAAPQPTVAPPGPLGEHEVVEHGAERRRSGIARTLPVLCNVDQMNEPVSAARVRPSSPATRSPIRPHIPAAAFDLVAATRELTAAVVMTDVDADVRAAGRRRARRAHRACCAPRDAPDAMFLSSSRRRAGREPHPGRFRSAQPAGAADRVDPPTQGAAAGAHAHAGRGARALHVRPAAQRFARPRVRRRARVRARRGARHRRHSCRARPA